MIKIILLKIKKRKTKKSKFLKNQIFEERKVESGEGEWRVNDTVGKIVGQRRNSISWR